MRQLCAAMRPVGNNSGPMCGVRVAHVSRWQLAAADGTPSEIPQIYLAHPRGENAGGNGEKMEGENSCVSTTV